MRIKLMCMQQIRFGVTGLLLGWVIWQGRAEASASELTLATDGVAQAVIVAGPDDPHPVRFAAAELAEHLRIMTGADFEIVPTAPVAGVAILLGQERARQAGIDVTGVGRDGYTIRMVGERIYIAGVDDTTDKSRVLLDVTTPLPRDIGRFDMERLVGEPTFDFERGTLYGTYRFLEELGVRWFFPGSLGRRVPDRPGLTVAPIELTEAPHYILRKVGTTTWSWYLLDTQNYRGIANPEEYETIGYGGRALRLWLMRNRGSSEWFAYNHRPNRLELEQRFGDTHPEYFALRPNGARDLAPQTGRTGHLCYTTDGVFELTKRDIDAYFAGTPAAAMGISDFMVGLNPLNRGWSSYAMYGRSVSMLPHDSFAGCQTPGCLAVTRPDLPFTHRHSQLVWPFVIRVAEWMQQAHPNAFIINLAYASYTEPWPALTSLPENIVVGLCPAFHAKTYNDLDDEGYGELMRLVTTWSAMNDRPMLIWLHHLYRFRRPTRQGLPMLLTGFFDRLFKDLAPHANMVQIEQDWDSLMLEHLNRYVVLKLLFDPGLSAKDLVEDYALKFYGPRAGPVALALLRDVEARSVAIGRTRANSIDAWEEHFSEDVVAGYRQQADVMLGATVNTDYEDATKLFSRYFVGEIERGRHRYLNEVKTLAASDKARVEWRSAAGPIRIDGRLDEPAWQQATVTDQFSSNVDGQPTQTDTRLRLFHTPQDLYLSFTCYDPQMQNISTEAGASESIEFFLDPEHDHDSYYWIQIDGGLRILDWYIHSAMEPPDEDWDSGVEVAVQHYDDRWVMEIRLPREKLAPAEAGDQWGANFCRSMRRPLREQDRYSSWSPLVRGKFHQPDLFGHVVFSD